MATLSTWSSFAGLFIAINLGISTIASSQTPPNLDEAEGAILQANGPNALRILRDIPNARLSGTGRVQRNCMIRRLTSGRVYNQPRLADPFANHLRQLYQAYWRRALAAPDRRDSIESQFVANLRRLTGQGPSADLDVVESAIEARLSAAGMHVLLGKTGQLLELMLWSGQEEVTHQVQLPQSTQRVTVFIMRDFVSAGWARHMTCGATGTGGWNNDRGLWIVAAEYGDLNDEDFRVNFLAHESQHYSDQRFPALPSWRLEYRAKLVELWLVDATREATIRQFMANQSDDEAIAHSLPTDACSRKCGHGWHWRTTRNS